MLFTLICISSMNYEKMKFWLNIWQLLCMTWCFFKLHYSLSSTRGPERILCSSSRSNFRNTVLCALFDRNSWSEKQDFKTSHCSLKPSSTHKHFNSIFTSHYLIVVKLDKVQKQNNFVVLETSQNWKTHFVSTFSRLYSTKWHISRSERLSSLNLQFNASASQSAVNRASMLTKWHASHI